jgi:hypothetical protein
MTRPQLTIKISAKANLANKAIFEGSVFLPRIDFANILQKVQNYWLVIYAGKDNWKQAPQADGGMSAKEPPCAVTTP